MEPMTHGSGAPATDAGGAGVPNSEPSQLETKQTAKVVPWDDHEKALNDMHRYKKELREMKAQLGSIESERLREKEDYKGLADKYKRERDEFEGKYSKTYEAFVNTHKHNAVQAAAVQAGMRPEAIQDLDLLPLDSVGVEMTSNGRFIVQNAETYVESLRQAKPHWFKSAQIPVVNTGGTGVAPGAPELTAEFMNKLEVQDPKKYRELLPKFREQLNKK